jgi:hypothetical protein
VPPPPNVNRTAMALALVLLAVSATLTAVLMRPKSTLITLPLVPLRNSPQGDSLARHVDSLRRALDARIAVLSGRAPAPNDLVIGGPVLVAVVPDSLVSGPDARARVTQRRFLASLRGAARVAAEARFEFCVRPSAGLRLRDVRSGLLRHGQVSAREMGYVLTAPGFPAVHVPAPISDSALAAWVARYGVLIGVTPPGPQPS